MEKFTMHTDPGHGWLEISAAEFKALGLERSQISAYSYFRALTTGDVYYLEEDCDAGLVVSALKASGTPFEIVDLYKENSFIHGLRHIWDDGRLP